MSELKNLLTLGTKTPLGAPALFQISLGSSVGRCLILKPFQDGLMPLNFPTSKVGLLLILGTPRSPPHPSSLSLSLSLSISLPIPFLSPFFFLSVIIPIWS